MVQDSHGGTSLLERRGQIPGPTPVAVPQKKNHVAELLSRLTLSTASSRAKADAKRSPAISQGHYFAQGIAPNHIARAAKVPARPFIGRPTPINTSSASGIASVAATHLTVHSNISQTTQLSAKTRTPEKKGPTAVTTSGTSRTTSEMSPHRRPTAAAASSIVSTPGTPTKSGSGGLGAPGGGGGRQSPHKLRPTKVVGRQSAMGRQSALRNQMRGTPGGFSRVQELKLKVSELERVMSQAHADKELIGIQAARIRELEDQFPLSDAQSIASTSTAPFSPAMRRISQVSSIDKWEQQEQTIKQREERVRMREDRVVRADTQAKAAQADAKAAVAEKEAILRKQERLESQRRHDREKLEALHEELDMLKTSRDSLQRQVTAFQVSHRTLEKQLGIAQRDARRAKRAVASLETNINDLKITVEEKNLENDELNRSINRVMQQTASLLRPDSSTDSLDGGADRLSFGTPPL